MPIVLNGTTGITTPTYNGNTTAEYLVPVTAFKNRIINGAMVIDQRYGGTATANTISGYTVDRWVVVQVSTTGKLIAQQNAGSVTPPVGFSNYLGVTSQSAYSVGASEFYSITQSIEGYNVADLGWGTANAKTITLSFWVRSSLTGTFGGALNNGGTRSYPFTYTISAANTWEQKSITIAGDTSGTWGTTNGQGIQVWLGLGVGSTYSGTAGAWAGANYLGATGSVSVVGTSGATFYITGVQLEVGSTATSFDYRPYGTELALCQRYYFKNAPSSIADAGLGSGVQTSTIAAAILMNLPVQMRSAPTIAQSNTIISDNSSFDANVTSIDAGNFTASSGYANIGFSTAGAQFRPVLFRAKSSGSIGFISFSAEL
jgi:hypothetical protein